MGWPRVSNDSYFLYYLQFPKATTVQDEEFEHELNKFVHEGMEAQRKARSQKNLELKLPTLLMRYELSNITINVNPLPTGLWDNKTIYKTSFYGPKLRWGSALPSMVRQNACRNENFLCMGLLETFFGLGPYIFFCAFHEPLVKRSPHLKCSKNIE